MTTTTLARRIGTLEQKAGARRAHTLMQELGRLSRMWDEDPRPEELASVVAEVKALPHLSPWEQLMVELAALDLEQDTQEAGE